MVVAEAVIRYSRWYQTSSIFNNLRPLNLGVHEHPRGTWNFHSCCLSNNTKNHITNWQGVYNVWGICVEKGFQNKYYLSRGTFWLLATGCFHFHKNEGHLVGLRKLSCAVRDGYVSAAATVDNNHLLELVARGLPHRRSPTQSGAFRSASGVARHRHGISIRARLLALHDGKAAKASTRCVPDVCRVHQQLRLHNKPNHHLRQILYHQIFHEQAELLNSLFPANTIII